MVKPPSRAVQDRNHGFILGATLSTAIQRPLSPSERHAYHYRQVYRVAIPTHEQLAPIFRMKHIGPYKLKNNLFLAPMVGVSDTPFREICSEQGAGLTVGEMLTCNKDLWHSERNRLKRIKPRIPGPQVVQIAGSDPFLMAEAAQLNEAMGASAIDINMGCPAKKVLKKAAGSALLKDTGLVESILKSVVSSVDIPVTLKIRTGWCPETRNGPLVARIAEDAGVQLLTVHGRTRADRFKGKAEYDTIAEIKQAVTIPIIANGDIDTPQKAASVLAHTRADGVMIGRAAYHTPADVLLQADRRVFGVDRETDPVAVVRDMLPYIERHLVAGGKLGQVTRHMLGLFAGQPGARAWRRHLSENATRPGAGPDVVRAALEFVQPKAA